ncbi:hypothetical protein DN752_19305 [Echinicola strongylocentroti]|uniref:Uncharacterized protein n=1 Tax=Echinicola strongylocentroti TaxID=1795355 RepID=A0A2Z4ILW2_9BACT|nr:DUF6515 family protein [Echinicola strongylocentroti]AWW32111.1 hypothetical protein DN752_19305 [Echinicola strongylocentroti]
MKRTMKKLSNLLLFCGIIAMLGLPDIAEAQRLRHSGGASRGGAAARPSGNRSINGGATRSPSRPSNLQSRSYSNNTRNRTNTNIGNQRNNTNRNTNVRNNNSRNNNTRVSNVKSNNRVGNNNRVNIDNSTNINVNRNVRRNVNRRSTVVIRNPRPYPRPPYRYGGFSFFCYHPYYYHPYTPYYWGPVWHPWGFFIASLAATAIVISIENEKYHYDEGVFYQESNNGYTVVEAPSGATVKTIPGGSEQVVINETTNNYYYGGTYYEKSDEGYTVVPPTSGAVVTNLPEGAEEVKVGDQTYVKYGETYYQPVQVDNKNKYEVADVQDADQ